MDYETMGPDKYLQTERGDGDLLHFAGKPGLQILLHFLGSGVVPYLV